MDENQKAIIRRQMQKTGEALTRNRMHVYYADSKSEALEQVKSLLYAGGAVHLILLFIYYYVQQ